MPCNVSRHLWIFPGYKSNGHRMVTTTPSSKRYSSTHDQFWRSESNAHRCHLQHHRSWSGVVQPRATLPPDRHIQTGRLESGQTAASSHPRWSVIWYDYDIRCCCFSLSNLLKLISIFVARYVIFVLDSIAKYDLFCLRAKYIIFGIYIYIYTCIWIYIYELGMDVFVA